MQLVKSDVLKICEQLHKNDKNAVYTDTAEAGKNWDTLGEYEYKTWFGNYVGKVTITFNAGVGCSFIEYKSSVPYEGVYRISKEEVERFNEKLCRTYLGHSSIYTIKLNGVSTVYFGTALMVDTIDDVKSMIDYSRDASDRVFNVLANRDDPNAIVNNFTDEYILSLEGPIIAVESIKDHLAEMFTCETYESTRFNVRVDTGKYKISVSTFRDMLSISIFRDVEGLNGLSHTLLSSVSQNLAERGFIGQVSEHAGVRDNWVLSASYGTNIKHIANFERTLTNMIDTIDTTEEIVRLCIDNGVISESELNRIVSACVNRTLEKQYI